MLRTSHTATRAARGRTSILANHHRYHSRLTRFEPLESRQLLTATVIEVTNVFDAVDPNDGLISLREAIQQANASPEDNEIHVPAGTYKFGSGSTYNIANNGSLKIIGAGSASTTIDAATIPSLVFNVEADAFAEFEGLTIRGGGSSNGGIRNFIGHVVISECVITQNFTGGIGNFGVMEIRGSTISDNVRTGILNRGKLTITDSTISGHSAYQGGGINNRGELTVVNCTLSDNSATFEGGAIYTNSPLPTRIENSVIAGNSDERRGGGIMNLDGNVLISGGSIDGNAAPSGAGVYNELTSYPPGFPSGVPLDIQMSIAGVTISNNVALSEDNKGSGGGIHNAGRLEIVDSTISNNTAGSRGGGIESVTPSSVAYTNLGNLTISGSTVSGNSAVTGGGIYSGGRIAIVNSIVFGNSANRGGGLYQNVGVDTALQETGSAAILRSNFYDNVADLGGAIYDDGASMTVTDSTLSNNSATSGGGIYIYGARLLVGPRPDLRPLYLGNLYLTRSTLDGNSATEDGGGIYSTDGWLEISTSTLSNNTAGRNGGGAFKAVSPTIVRGSTITGNRADTDGNGSGAGGGLYLRTTEFGTVTYYNSIDSSILAGNFRGAPAADVFSDIEFASGPQLSAASSFNLIGDPNTAGGLVHGSNGNIVGDGSGNPLDVSTVLDTTLADHGGPTRTHALLATSPAVNAGDPLFDPNATSPPILFDQRGAGYARVFDGRVDIGAYEAGATFQTVVAGRHIFYDDSVYDNNTPGANPHDFFAIATDKQPLLPGGGLASAANVTSYVNGINGITIDIAGSHPDITAADFQFRVGNNNSPGSWALAPAPAGVIVLAGQGDAGADRVVITWPFGAIKNTWLEVQVLATANTGLATSDVFYWGNKVGDSFTSPGAGLFNTTSTDAAQVYAKIGAAKPMDVRDYNRDGSVNSTDAAIVYANIGSLVRISIAPPVVFQAAPLTAADDGLSTVASALGQRGVSKATDSLPSVDSSMRNETPVALSPQETRVAVTSDPHFEALSAASDSLEDILFEVDNELCEPVLAELI